MGVTMPMMAVSYGVEDITTCNSLGSSCGPGRENGYSVTYLTTGCRNYKQRTTAYKGYIVKYGTINVPYWINNSSGSSGLSTAEANAIRAQANFWNSVAMCDGTGQLVNMYEPDPGATTLPTVSGYPVCEIYKGTTGTSGEFDPNTIKIKLSSTLPLTSPSQSIYGEVSMQTTPMHEIGHMLALPDLDWDGTTLTYDHNVRMGYKWEGVTGLHYQDIQGLAVATNKHTNHDYRRYVKNGNDYHHFCFYCDIMDITENSAKSGSQAMVLASTCSHDYQPMVSAGNTYWYKCTKCYKVDEQQISPFVINDTYYYHEQPVTCSYSVPQNLFFAFTTSGDKKLILCGSAGVSIDVYDDFGSFISGGSGGVSGITLYAAANATYRVVITSHTGAPTQNVKLLVANAYQYSYGYKYGTAVSHNFYAGGSSNVHTDSYQFTPSATGTYQLKMTYPSPYTLNDFNSYFAVLHRMDNPMVNYVILFAQSFGISTVNVPLQAGEECVLVFYAIAKNPGATPWATLNINKI